MVMLIRGTAVGLSMLLVAILSAVELMEAGKLYKLYQFGDAHVRKSIRPRTDKLDMLALRAKNALFMLSNKEFNTNFSTNVSVLQGGFPVRWDACTLSHLSIHSNTSFQISLVGGSSTARSAGGCRPTNDELGNRYSNILSEELARDLNTTNIAIVNLGHGATDSLWSSLTIDQVLDAENCDLLVWEYATNDALGGDTYRVRRSDRVLSQMLDLWFWRVHKHFQAAGRQPPPILLLYLWDSVDLGQSAFLAQSSVVDHYRRAGFSISVVNVGGALANWTNGKEELLDDGHHPGCGGVHLVTAMIRHVLYSDILSCPNNGRASSFAKKKIQLLRPMTEPSENRSHAVLNALLGEETIGSLMQWTPQAGQSKLVLTGEEAVTETMTGAKQSSSRTDQKRSYTLLRCPETVNFTLVEPTLKWLGVGKGGGFYGFHGYRGKIEVFVNGDLTNMTLPYRLEMDDEVNMGTVYPYLVEHWIHVPEVTVSASEYRVQVCYVASELSRCPFYNASSIEEACSIWLSKQNDINVDCFFRNSDQVSNACLDWYGSPEGRALQEMHGWWVGEWGTGSPQLNWLIGVKS